MPVLNAAEDGHKPVQMQSEYRRKEVEKMPKLTLKAARVNAGYTQTEAAEKLGVAMSTIRNWEKGITYPKQPQIIAICELYKVNYDNIFFGV